MASDPGQEDYLSEGDVQFIYNHVVLPPQLPGGSDSEDRERELRFLRLVRDQARLFCQLLPESSQAVWRRIVGMLDSWLAFTLGDIISSSALVSALSKMEIHGE